MARDRRQTASIPKRGQLTTSHSPNIAAANLRCAAALVSALVEGGVQHVAVSSGSRCAPLVLACGSHPALRLWTNPDERSAAFFALGAAKGSRRPAALICTSGTAAANFFPAVVEAHMSGVPLVVVTADRPPRLRGTGASQTIDQQRLYGGYALGFDDLPVPGIGSDDASEWRRITLSTVGLATNAAGPVHLNAPFEEPLLVGPEEAAAILKETGSVQDEIERIRTSYHSSDSDASRLLEIGSLLQKAKRPVIVCGPQNGAADLLALTMAFANLIGAPILADVASQLRSVPEAITHYDLILRDEKVRAYLDSDCIVRFGGLPTSKSLNHWIATAPARVKIGISSGPVADPDRCLTHSVRTNCAVALRALTENLRPDHNASVGYKDSWSKLDRATAIELGRFRTHSDEVLESEIVSRLCELAGEDTNLFLSNSMPIRWADMYSGARTDFPGVFVNRGANGIDGIISTAAGLAVSTQTVTVCVLGDLTFLHDQNGLWRLVSEKVPLKLVLLNNDGGGVFHFLPIASFTEHFEPYVAMPHGIDFSKLAAAHGIRYHRAESTDDFSDTFKGCLGRSGPDVIEVRTDRARNFERHQEVVRVTTRIAREILGIA